MRERYTHTTRCGKEGDARKVRETQRRERESTGNRLIREISARDLLERVVGKTSLFLSLSRREREIFRRRSRSLELSINHAREAKRPAGLARGTVLSLLAPASADGILMSGRNEYVALLNVNWRICIDRARLSFLLFYPSLLARSRL